MITVAFTVVVCFRECLVSHIIEGTPNSIAFLLYFGFPYPVHQHPVFKKLDDIGLKQQIESIAFASS